MQLTIKEIEVLLAKVLGKLKSEGVETIEFPDIAYRYIPTDEWERFDDTVVELGDLSDDIESLRLLCTDMNRPCMYIDFDRLATVLRATSQILNPG